MPDLQAIPSALRKELREELKAAGVFDRDAGRAWRKWASLLTAALTATAAAALLPSALDLPGPAALLLLPFAAVLWTAFAMTGHEGAHKSMASSSRHNSAMLHLTFPLISGLGAHHWKWKHNLLHHQHPNVPGQDFDLQMWPMASHAQDYAAASPLRQLFIRHGQQWAFWPLTALLPYAMRLNSWRILLRTARKDGIGKAWLLDAGCLLGHLTLWLVLPSLVVGFGTAFAFYAALWSMVGVCLSLVFAPAHVGMPIQQTHPDDWLGQLQTTRNLRMPGWLSYLFIGLDYQVEHHLFPGVSQFQLPKAAAITKAWAARHGLPYHEIDYGAGVVDVTRYLGRAWREPTVAVGDAQMERQAA